MHVIPGYSKTMLLHIALRSPIRRRTPIALLAICSLLNRASHSQVIKNIWVFLFRASSSLSQKCSNLQPLSGFTIIYPVNLLLLPDDGSGLINTISQVKWFSIHGFCSYNQGPCQLSPKMIISCPLTCGHCSSLSIAQGFILYTSHCNIWARLRGSSPWIVNNGLAAMTGKLPGKRLQSPGFTQQEKSRNDLQNVVKPLKYKTVYSPVLS